MILALLACDPIPIEPRGACPDGAEGRFELLEADGLTGFSGRVWDGAPPGQRQVTARVGDCELLERVQCACGTEQTCAADGSCRDWPASVDLGTLRLHADGRTRLEPVQPGNVYSAAVDPEPGEPIGLSGTDLHLGTTAVQPLVGVEGPWTLGHGDLDLIWSPSDGTDRVVATLAVDQHGASQAALRCTLPDTGTARIPVEALDALLAVGVSGFPSGSLRRERVDHAVVDGRCLELASVSAVDVSLELP